MRPKMTRDVVCISGIAVLPKGGEIVKNTQFKSTIAEIVDVPTGDYKNPFLTKIKFVFADNGVNVNNQGIEEDDFDEVIQTSINMPIKMSFTGAGAGNHYLATPIGHITNMIKESEDSTSKLIGEAVLYKEEFPEEVQYLKDSYAEGDSPGISWELAYADSVVKNGVEWLKNIVTMAAAFVGKPAYGKRTSLLAIASQVDNDAFMSDLKDLITSWEEKSKGIAEGGNRVDELEKAKAAVEELTAKLAELQEKFDAQTEALNAQSEALTGATETVQTLKSEKEELQTEVASYKKTALVAERTAKVAEAGIKFELEGEALTQKQDLWASMSDEVFSAYLADLAVAKSQRADASSHQGDLPRFTGASGTETTLEDLKAVGRRASRGELSL